MDVVDVLRSSHIQSPHRAQAQQVDLVVDKLDKVSKDHPMLAGLPEKLRYNGQCVMCEIKQGQDVD